MSFPPPPGLQQQPSRPSSSQPQSNSSLPPRPPSAPFTSNPGLPLRYQNNAADSAPKPSGGFSTFNSFQPRSVAASTTQSYKPHSPAVSGPPPSASGGYSTPTTYSSGYQYPQQHSQQHPQSYQAQSTSYYGQPTHYGNNAYNQQSTSHVQNSYPSQGRGGNNNAGYGGSRDRAFGRQGEPAMDPETEAQIAQWQSAYMGKDSEAAAQIPGPGSKPGMIGRREGGFSATGANTGPLGNVQRLHDSSAPSTPPIIGPQTPSSSTPNPNQQPSAAPASVPESKDNSKTVIRSGGGQTWTDSTLLEWDPAHFRLFCGNLAGEVTDDSLHKAFTKYPSVQRARVIRDKRTEKSKGYGFISFSDGDDYFRAAREMQGKYIGSHPVLLRRAMTEIRPVQAGKGGGRGGKYGGKGRSSGSGAGAGGGDGKAGKGGGNKPSDGGIQKKQGKTKGGLRVLG